ncbi:hypothetical protein CRU99_10165 [Malaciobacter mytili]|uniref:DUF3373 family protein n=1 Tax=Malaciobacter mytili TaxID=603050 RepID=UPI00100C0D75|nr:DUF3373 family protein [Malaciobacter mytili]RXI40665.1 hypothetical protein CRU99_10165 [Malaciobacter mytili]
MKKGIIALSTVAALTTCAFSSEVSNNEMMKQIELLKKQIEMLEKKLNSNQDKVTTLEKTFTDKRFTKLEKNVKKNSEKIQEVKAHDAGDNIKWDVDFRTQYDNVQYKLSNGKKLTNNSIYSNRLWLGMKFQADENSTFYGTLSYNKLFGDNRAQIDGQTRNNASFDWVTNEAATNDNSLKVKEAYWLYTNDSFFGNNDVSWTASIGRRPSTDGLGISLRADQERKSALSHTVNVEFDGASARFNLDKLTGINGMWLKFCVGRGLTNAKLRFSSDGLDYIDDNDTSENVDMAGFIFVPYDNGQYSVHMNYAKAWNLIGNQDANADGQPDSNGKFYNFGDIELATIMFKAYGIGNGISDFLDDTTVFASYAMSKTDPDGNKAMLGSADSETGHSFWIGANMPCPLSEKARVGIEWNKGSKYWRSMTYGEDTMAGSKIAARGTAWEVYRHQKLTDALSFTLRYTQIKYDYTGSNGFFGDFGTPVKISDSPNAVEEAKNFSANIRYRF